MSGSNRFNLTFLINLLFTKYVYSFFDPLSLSLVAGGASLLYHQRANIQEYTYCQVKECCIDSHIPANITALSQDMQLNLFGQHIVHEQLIPALRSHYNNLGDSKKPLVLSFHGTPGTGKNYVADRIAMYLYKYGTKSEFVVKFMGRTDFAMESEVLLYRHLIKTKITETVKRCPRALFIFDEVDKMPSGVFDSITSLLDHHDNIDGVIYRHATFIFLTNAGGAQISEKLMKLLKSGKLREETKLFDFEKLNEMAAYNVIGGLHKTSMIEASLIDHFIPFLPLEKRHVEKCIIAEFKQKGIDNPTHETVQEITNNYVIYKDHLFAVSGCKRLNAKVAVYAEQYS